MKEAIRKILRIENSEKGQIMKALTNPVGMAYFVATDFNPLYQEARSNKKDIAD